MGTNVLHVLLVRVLLRVQPVPLVLLMWLLPLLLLFLLMPKWLHLPLLGEQLLAEQLRLACYMQLHVPTGSIFGRLETKVSDM